MIYSISLILMAVALLWEGAKGFRPCGIKFGIWKAGSEPVTGQKGKIIGGVVIALGLLCVAGSIYLEIVARRLIGPLR